MSLSVIIDGVTHHVNQVTITANNSLAPPGINPPPITQIQPNISSVMPVTGQEQLQQQPPPPLFQPTGEPNNLNPQNMLAAGQHAMGNMMHLNPQSMLAAAGQHAVGNMQNPIAQSAFGAAKQIMGSMNPGQVAQNNVQSYVGPTNEKGQYLLPQINPNKIGGSKKRRNKRSNNTRKYRRIRKRSSKR